MPSKHIRKGKELFIVDNSDSDWKVRDYLHDWVELSNKFDIATGYFEIGSLLALDGQWQQLEQIRILMGDEVSRRTKKAFLQSANSIKSKLDASIEKEKENNDFLEGVPGIVDALKAQKILCRVYNKDKFHAKAYITHSKHEVVGSSALVGSSNFTYPGLTDNVELNVQLRTKVEELQEWYEKHWNDAEDVTPEILKVIERHTRDFTPFEVYAKALHEFFRGHEMTLDEWELAEPEKGGSRVFKILDQYQREGYQALMKIARQYGGAFLCDGVGLGKTFIGLMLIERLIMHDRKRVALFVPKAARVDVWEREIKNHLPHVGGISGGDFSNLVIFNHTDLNREGEFPYRFERIKEMADVFIIDEAHHFRNPGIKGTGKKKPSRYRTFYDLIESSNGVKQVFHITATPVNNRIIDFRHMLELFTRKKEDYFKSTLGIHSIRGHFNKMEKALKMQFEGIEDEDITPETNLAEAKKILTDDGIFQKLVVQRSRAYVKASQIQHGAKITSFPERQPPQVADYSIKVVYGRLLEMVDRAFQKDKPLFALGIYYPLAYYIGTDEEIDPWTENRQKQVIGLIKTQFLKRLESSAHAFERSCDRLLMKLLIWIKKHSETKREKQRLEKWMGIHEDIIGSVQKRQLDLWDEDADEDFVTEEMLEDVEYLSREEYDVKEILNDSFVDMDQVIQFLGELKKFKPRNDSKLSRLVKLLKTDKALNKHKVLVFTEFAETARYLLDQLKQAEIEGVSQIDSMTKGDRSEIIHRFAPYYNGLSSGELVDAGKKEIRILISTDVLSEGLNLQDATRLINYDLHWNPVRLMQRIGRVDRRLNPEIEEIIIRDHPDQGNLRGTIAYWNFLPPEELEDLLKLYKKVSNKTLKISKTFGIEGKKLLTPDDDYDALKEFNENHEGEKTSVEKMRLEYTQILNDNPELEDHLNSMPLKIFSGKEHPSDGTKAVFFCYAHPALDTEKVKLGITDSNAWTEEAGVTKWYLYDIESEKITMNPSDIIEIIRSLPLTPRKCEIERITLTEIRRKIEKHIKNDYFKKVQAPIGVKATLKAWMELN